MLVDQESAEKPETQAPAVPGAAASGAAPVAAPSEPSKVSEASPETTEPKSALDAALRAMEKVRGEDKVAAALPVEPANPNTEQQAQQDGDQGDDPGDVPMLAPDVFRALPKEARTVLKDLRVQVKTLRPDAERGQAVASYMKETGISPAEFVELQEIGALIKRDPAKGREALLKHLDRLDEHLGYKLPNDLRVEVESGAMTEELAAQHARTRAERDAATRALAERDARQAEAAMVSAVEAWAAEQSRQDPDFGRKLPNIHRETKLLVMERAQAGRPPRTAEEAIEIAKMAYANAEEVLKPFRPAPAAVPRSPSSAAASVPAAAPAPPKTALEAAYAGLQSVRRG